MVTRPINVYYFCRQILKGKGVSYNDCKEYKCLRVLEGDYRLNTLYNEYYKLGRIHQINYQSALAPNKVDIEWEKRQVQQTIWGFSRYVDTMTVVTEVELK